MSTDGYGGCIDTMFARQYKYYRRNYNELDQLAWSSTFLVPSLPDRCILVRVSTTNARVRTLVCNLSDTYVLSFFWLVRLSFCMGACVNVKLGISIYFGVDNSIREAQTNTLLVRRNSLKRLLVLNRTHVPCLSVGVYQIFFRFDKIQIFFSRKTSLTADECILERPIEPSRQGIARFFLLHVDRS